MTMLPRGRMLRMEMVNTEKMQSLPQTFQNLFLYHHVSPGRCPLLLMKTGLSKLTLHPEGLRFSRAHQEDTTTATMMMEEQTTCRKLQAWR